MIKFNVMYFFLLNRFELEIQMRKLMFASTCECHMIIKESFYRVVYGYLICTMKVHTAISELTRTFDSKFYPIR